MNTKQKNQIKAIAQRVFERAKKYGRSNHFEFMAGACGVASAWALEELHRLKINAQAIRVKSTECSHVFILINKEYILDITYQQFNAYCKTYVFIHKSERWEYDCNSWFWNLRCKKVRTKSALVRLQVKEKWPQNQIAI